MIYTAATLVVLEHVPTLYERKNDFGKLSV